MQVDVVGGLGARADLPEAAWRRVESDATRMFRLDDELGSFYERCRREGAPFAEAPRTGFGRLLRSPTLFEDLVKVLATTNTTWGGTKSMVSNLVRLAGSRGAFPTPRQVARLGADRIREEARWGYRAEYLAELSRDVDRGAHDLDRWDRWCGTTDELEAEVRALPGFGPYATAHVLSLLGRFDRIGVDTAFRAFMKSKYFPKARKPVTDARMVSIYDRWGEWRGLAYWFDLWYEAAADEL